MKKNVLITSCGAKVALVRAFHESVASRDASVFVSDISAHAAACYEADGRVDLPPWDDPGYGDALLTACGDLDIGLIVPTADAEMPSLTPVADALWEEGTVALVAPPAALSLCRDKIAFSAFCCELGFPIPQTYLDAEMPSSFPVFVRPRMGRGGLGACRVETPALLQAMRVQDSDLLVQQFVDWSEYSVDLLMDIRGGRALQAVARRRLAVRGGEAQVSRVERRDELTDLAILLGQSLKLVGHNVVQAFYSAQDGVRLIEVNPRFGGASILSIYAGLDSPARLLDLLAGDEKARRPRAIRYGLTMLRHGEDRFVMSGSPI